MQPGVVFNFVLVTRAKNPPEVESALAVPLENVSGELTGVFLL